MRKIVVTMWMSLDGFISGPDNSMGWVSGHFDEEMGQYEGSIVDAADTLMLGRLTYESFAGSWPSVPDNPNVSEEEKGYARKLNAMRKVVFSRTMEKADWNNSLLVKEGIEEAAARVKAEPGKDILIYGSASIVRQLLAAGLVDELQLLVYPLALGAGKSLFAGLPSSHQFKLDSSKVFKSGVVQLNYLAG